MSKLPGSARRATPGAGTPGETAIDEYLSALLIRFGFAAAGDEEIKNQSREQPNQHLSEDGVHLASPFIENSCH